MNAPTLEYEPVGGFPDSNPLLAPRLRAPRALGQVPAAPRGPAAEDEGHDEVREIPEVREVEKQHRQVANAPRIAEEAR